MERRLAAILAADVVGYSRLMEADEAGTLATLQTSCVHDQRDLLAADPDHLLDGLRKAGLPG
jgi:adenylate cyclase